MKHRVLTLFAIIATIVLMISCSKNDDDTITTDSMVGTWVLRQAKTTASGDYVDWPYATTTATFNNDGTYAGSGYFGNGYGTWTRDGDTIKCYVSGSLYATYVVISYSTTNSEIKMTCNGVTLWIICSRG